MVRFQFDERLLVRCRKRRKKEGHAGIWLTVMLLMLLSIATSRASASCTEKAWGIQSLFSVILICIKKEFDFFGGEVGVRVVSLSYIFAHEIETIFTALYETPPLHSFYELHPPWEYFSIRVRACLCIFLFRLAFTSIILFLKKPLWFVSKFDTIAFPTSISRI